MITGCFKVSYLEIASPCPQGGVTPATLLHFSGSNERLVWNSQIEKSKVGNQPFEARRIRF